MQKTQSAWVSGVVAGSAVAAITGTPCTAAAEQLGSWTVSEMISPLTNAVSFTASTPSTQPLRNMLGLPETAALVLRCQEGSRAAYVSWPQVISQQTRTALLNLPATVVLKKVDDGPITSDIWVISDSGIGAGAFDNLGAPKIIAGLHGAKRLVVRLTGQTTQDAVFDLTGVDGVIDRLEATCGSAAGRAGGRGAVASLLPMVTDSAPVPRALQAPPEAVREAALKAMGEMGFKNAHTAPGGVLAPLQNFTVTSKQVDCGRVLGLPYAADRRVHLQVQPAVKIEAGRAIARLTIAAIMKVGVGAPDKPLKCVSTGALEGELLDRIVASVEPG